MEDVAGLLARGQAARRVGETKMNRESSRSHSVFTCTLERSTTDASGITQILRSRLNLVDLAGSPGLWALFTLVMPGTGKRLRHCVRSCFLHETLIFWSGRFVCVRP